MKSFFFLALFFTFWTSNAIGAVTVEVSTTQQLYAEVSAANQRGGDTVILINSGTYRLSEGLSLTAPLITLRGQGSDRSQVIIEGDVMSPSAQVGSVISVYASDSTIENLTLQKCRWHIIQIHGEHNADRTTIRNCILRDSYEQMVKVTVNMDNLSISGDNGLVENNLFEYSAGIGPQYYIGGIDAHAAKNWIVRNNIFKYIISPDSRISEFAVHFWNSSADNLVEKNTIIDCDRAIGFGLDQRPNSGGIIRNNMIYHSADNGAHADTAIALTESPNTHVYNNTIFHEHTYPNAIEYRFSSTTGIYIANNLTNKSISARNGATGQVEYNITNAESSWFTDVAAGDLHLTDAGRLNVRNKGIAISELTDDFDGHPRVAVDGFVDTGADEIVTIYPPENLRKGQ